MVAPVVRGLILAASNGNCQTAKTVAAKRNETPRVSSTRDLSSEWDQRNLGRWRVQWIRRTVRPPLLMTKNAQATAQQSLRRRNPSGIEIRRSYLDRKSVGGSSSRNSRSECEIHIRAAAPSLAPPHLAPLSAQGSCRTYPSSIILHLLLRAFVAVVSLRIASTIRETSRNLNVSISTQCKKDFLSCCSLTSREYSR